MTGGHLYNHTDLAIGSSSYPFCLDFERSYNSDARLKDGPLGLGWTSNFDQTATPYSDGFQGLGEDSPVDAAAAIAGQFVSLNILTGKNTKTLERLVISTISQRWFMDQLIDNAVLIREPHLSLKFVRLADGSFNPPPGDASLLTRAPDQSFHLRTKDGIRLDYDLSGRLVTWKDPNDNTVSLAYTGEALTSVTNDFARTLTFSYVGGRIDSISDGTGRSVHYRYDGIGDLTGFTDALGQVITYTYDLPGRLTRVYRPSNPTVPYVTKTYDALDQVTSQTNGEGHTTHYYISGFRTEEVDPLGNARIELFDERGRTWRTIDALGHATSYVYDGQDRLVLTTFPEGNSVAYEYDAQHNLIKETLHPKPGSPLSPIQRQYTYDPVFNRLLTATDPLDNTTTYAYDTKGNLTSVEQPEVGGVAPLTVLTNNSHGQPETVTDPLGMITRYAYLPATGEVYSSTTDVGGLDLQLQLAYDDAGNLSQLTDPSGHATSYQFDALRRLTQITAPAPFNDVTKLSYDPVGDPIKLERETDDPLHPWQTTVVSYTVSGFKSAFQTPQGFITSYQYNQLGQFWKLTDAEGHTTEYRYNKLGRIDRVIDASGQITRYTYSNNGRLADITDANGHTTTYEYDGFDRLSRIICPDASYEAFTYDANGNLITKRNRAAQVISFAYDSLNRLIGKTLPGPTQIVLAYDLVGRLKDVTDPHGNIHYSYDSAGRLSSVQYPGAKTLGYQHDQSGNRTRLTYPDGSYITYSYDSQNRMTGIYDQAGSSIALYQYDALSRRVELDYANGASTSYAYDSDDDLTNLAQQFNGSQATFSYTYNKIGNQTSLVADDEQFLYQPQPFKVDQYRSDNLNRYTSLNSVPLAYDQNGNLTSDGINTYSYDAENRLISATTPSHSAAYAYDALGRRISKQMDGVSTSYVYDGAQPILEYNGSGQLLRRFVYGPGIDQPVMMVTNSDARYYYHYDSLGSVIALSDASGQVAETYAYSPFGEVNHASSLGNPFLFTGRAYDPETGLYDYRARAYDPRLGRFLQVDPIGYWDDLNLYAYVGNDPINWIDSSGLGEINYALQDSGLLSIGLSAGFLIIGGALVAPVIGGAAIGAGFWLGITTLVVGVKMAELGVEQVNDADAGQPSPQTPGEFFRAGFTGAFPVAPALTYAGEGDPRFIWEITKDALGPAGGGIDIIETGCRKTLADVIMSDFPIDLTQPNPIAQWSWLKPSYKSVGPSQ